jgi:hypothetical protein
MFPRTVALVGLVAASIACTSTPRDDVELSAGSTMNPDPTTGSSSDDGNVDPTDADDTAGPGGGPCNADDDCVGDAAGSVCDELLGVCGPGCTPGETRSCYSGPDGTQDVGACVAGTNTCSPQGKWDLWCAGEVLPDDEVCGNDLDDDCDGLHDDTDADGDGFGVCSGDCCDVAAACSEPTLVNPGAYEVVDNRLDDDCDGEIDEALPTCDATLASNSSDPLEFARALELCQFTEERPADPADRTWGVISADLSRADGYGSPLPVQHSLRSDFGNLLDPEAGGRMVVLSSGHAADTADTSPAFAPFEPGQNLNTTSAVPADWLLANGGAYPNPAGCPDPWNLEANDSAMLTLRIRAPTNANSFSMKMNFFSAEYPEYVCSPFNDFFVALVDSEADNPADGNIAIYDDDGQTWPVGVNLVLVADGLFTQCENGEVGCSEALGASYSGCVGTALLEGTGFDQWDPSACQASQTRTGGATGWLVMSGNVLPGEIVELRLAIWDSSGHIYDSLVLLDDFRWSVDAAQPGVIPG